MQHHEPIQSDSDKPAAAVLCLAFAGFFVAFGCWTLFAVVGIHIKAKLELSDLQFGTLLALPMLVGGLLAVPAGLAAQRFGARSTMLAFLAGLSAALPMFLWTSTLNGYYLIASGLGLAGGTFSAGLQFVRERTPFNHRGLFAGIFSAGMMGAGFNYYLAGLIHEAFDWQVVPLAYFVLLVLVTVLFALLTENDEKPRQPFGLQSMRSHLALLQQWDFVLQCLLYGVAGGGFVALTLWLPDFATLNYHLTIEQAALFAQGFILPGAFCLIIGGWLADRYSAITVLRRALIASLLPAFFLSYPAMSLVIQGTQHAIHLDFRLPLFVNFSLLMALGITLGLALGSLLSLLATQHPTRTALSAGIMLFSGSLAAFIMPVLFGLANMWIGVRSAAFMLLFGCIALGLIALTLNSRKHLRRQLFDGKASLSPWW